MGLAGEKKFGRSSSMGTKSLIGTDQADKGESFGSEDEEGAWRGDELSASHQTVMSRWIRIVRARQEGRRTCAPVVESNPGCWFTGPRACQVGWGLARFVEQSLPMTCCRLFDLMRRFRAEVVLFLGIVGLGLWVSGCGTVAENGVKSKAGEGENVLRVGITPTSPPLVFREEGHLTGLEIDLARQLGEAMGKEVRFVTVKWKDLISTLLNDRIDIIMSGMSITPIRNARVRFSDPYLQTGQMALVRREDLRHYVLGIPANLPGKVGVQSNTTGQFLVQQQFLQQESVVFEEARDAVKALMAGRIALFIHDAPVVWWFASEYEAEGLAVVPIALTRENLAWAVRPDDRELLKAANEFLEASRASGRLGEIIQRWLPYYQNP